MNLPGAITTNPELELVVTCRFIFQFNVLFFKKELPAFLRYIFNTITTLINFPFRVVRVKFLSEIFGKCTN